MTIDRILKLTDGFTGALIEGMINHASILALRDFLRKHRKFDAINVNTANSKIKNFRITFEYFKLAREKVMTNTKGRNIMR